MPEDAANLLVLWVAAYLIGAVPVSYMLAKVVGGIDLRQHGSGNLGASNVASQLGKPWWLVVAAVDFSRGAVPLLLGHYALGVGGAAWLLMLTPLFTILGNSWSPFLRFTGGRSVGIWAGGIIAFSPLFSVAALLLYLLGWRATRRSAEWLLAVMAALPALALAWPEELLLVGGTEQLALFTGAGALLILVKRLLSNDAPPAGLPLGSVLVNRLLRDRDLADREQWLARADGKTNNTG